MDTAAVAVRVVGVAVVEPHPDGGRVLAALRRASPAAPGGWELPGGKCWPGEPLELAAAREIREELGCEIRVTGRLAGVEPIRPGLTLEVVLAEVVAGEPAAAEHEQLRWLASDELGTVTWLVADRPFLPELRTLLEERR